LGKTSLIAYISSPERHASLFGDTATEFNFIHLDAQRFDRAITPVQFWKMVLDLLGKQLPDTKIRLAIAPAYFNCVDHNFSSEKVKDFFALLSTYNHLAILTIDEFDSVFKCPNLVDSTFFGGIRSVASASKGLSIVIASRLDFVALTLKTKEVDEGGSPLMNIFAQVPMSCFSYKDSYTLLEKGNEFFAPEDKEFVYKLSGGHPYFLQVAAYYLWDTYQDRANPGNIWEYVGEQLYPYIASTMKDTWRLWSPSVRKVFSILALNDIPRLIRKKGFDIDFLVNSLEDYREEMKFLERHGFLKSVKEGSKTNLHVASEAILWWIGDEIRLSMRDKDDLGKWLADQQWEGLLKKGEKAQLLHATGTLTGWLKGGIDVFVKSAAEGLGRGMSPK
jgi:hypothetical protein